MTLTAMEFLRRFVQHILPRGFVRIRQSGFLASTSRTTSVAQARTALAAPPIANTDAPPPTPPTTDTDTGAPWACPRCGTPMRIGPVLSAHHLAVMTWHFDTS